MKPISRRTLFLAAIALGLCKVLLVFLAIPELASRFPTHYRIDLFPDGYDRIAVNLIEGHGYRFFPETTPTMVRTPLYPLLLAGIFSLFGRSLAAVKAVNLLLGLVTAVVVYRLADAVMPAGYHKRPAPGAVAAAVFLLHPGVVFAETRGGVESLFALMIALYVLSLYRALRKGSVLRYAVSGASFGLMLLVKSSPALFAPALLPYLLLAGSRGAAAARETFVRFAVFAAAAAAVLSPWMVRNYSLTGKLIATSTVKGFAAHQGLHLNRNVLSSSEAYNLFDQDSENQKAMVKQLGLETRRESFFSHFTNPRDEVAFDAFLFEKVMKEYREDPRLLVQSAALNFYGFWFRGRTTRATTLNVMVTLPFLLLVLWGWKCGRRQGAKFGPLLLFVGAFVLPHLPILGLARYYIPLVPLLAVPAGLAAASTITKDPETNEPTGEAV